MQNNHYYLSCGIDVGTTTFHYAIIKVFQTSTAFQSNQNETDYEIVHLSPIFKTPYKVGSNLIDEHEILSIFDQSLKEHNVDINQINTGAVIITGMAVQKENASAIVKALSQRIPNLISTITGSRLEALLAAKGAGVDRYSKEHCKTVVNVDIGGGTSNIAIFKNGQLIDLASMWIGGNNIILNDLGEPIACNSFIEKLEKKRNIDFSYPNFSYLTAIYLIRTLWWQIYYGKQDTFAPELIDEPFLTYQGGMKIDYINFSGGVAEWIFHDAETIDETINDFGKDLAKAILALLPDEIELLRTNQPIRATVFGAGIHSMQISGDTIFVGNEAMLPLTNIPLVSISMDNVEQLQPTYIHAKSLHVNHNLLAIYIHKEKPFTFEDIQHISKQITYLIQNQHLEECVIVLNQNAAKILGYQIKNLLSEFDDLLVIDAITIQDFAYIDVGSPLPDNTLPVTTKHFVI